MAYGFCSFSVFLMGEDESEGKAEKWKNVGRGSGALVAEVRVWVPIFWVFEVENRTGFRCQTRLWGVINFFTLIIKIMQLFFFFSQKKQKLIMQLFQRKVTFGTLLVVPYLLRTHPLILSTIYHKSLFLFLFSWKETASTASPEEWACEIAKLGAFKS